MFIKFFIFWRDHGDLNVKTSKAGVGALEDSSIVVAFNVSPLNSGDVTLSMPCLIAAVELVSKLIEDLSMVDVKEI